MFVRTQLGITTYRVGKLTMKCIEMEVGHIFGVFAFHDSLTLEDPVNAIAHEINHRIPHNIKCRPGKVRHGPRLR